MKSKIDEIMFKVNAYTIAALQENKGYALASTVKELKEELRKMIGKALEENAADANRYRWLRDVSPETLETCPTVVNIDEDGKKVGYMLHGDDLDNSVDILIERFKK